MTLGAGSPVSDPLARNPDHLAHSRRLCSSPAALLTCCPLHLISPSSAASASSAPPAASSTIGLPCRSLLVLFFQQLFLFVCALFSVSPFFHLLSINTVCIMNSPPCLFVNTIISYCYCNNGNVCVCICLCACFGF